MTQFNQYIDQLKGIFQKNAKLEVKLKQEKFLVHNFEFYGLLTTIRKPLVKPLLQQGNQALCLDQKKLLFALLYEQKPREFQYSAMEFINYGGKESLTIDDLPGLLKIIRHNIGGDTTDYFDHVFGLIIFNSNDEKKAHEYLTKLINDQDDGVKRIAIQTQLMLKEKMDIDLLFTLIKPLLNTQNFYLVRSIVGSLRNAKRINREQVEHFVQEQRVNKKIIRVINEH